MSQPPLHLRNYQPIKERTRFLSKLHLALTNTASLDQFVVGRTIGVGSFGRVLLFKHKKTNYTYAAKVMNKEKIVRMNQAHRVVEEKRILQSICCKFLTDLRFTFKTNSNLFLLMPFIKGGELFSYLKKSTRFPESQVRFYVAQVLLAFEYLHTIEVVYRDLKPENVILECDGYLKLIDFGFAKHVPTSTSSFIGTPEYMAPEMLIRTRREKGYGYSVDVWSMGVFIYELTTGSPPFSGDNLFQVFNRIIKRKYSMPADFNVSLMDLLQKIFQVDVELRIGCGTQGVVELKNHAWFSEINWWALFEKKVKPYFIPTCSDQKEDANFSTYDEEPIEESEEEQYQELFSDF